MSGRERQYPGAHVPLRFPTGTDAPSTSQPRRPQPTKPPEPQILPLLATDRSFRRDDGGTARRARDAGVRVRREASEHVADGQDHLIGRGMPFLLMHEQRVERADDLD